MSSTPAVIWDDQPKAPPVATASNVQWDDEQPQAKPVQQAAPQVPPAIAAQNAIARKNIAKYPENQAKPDPDYVTRKNAFEAVQGEPGAPQDFQEDPEQERLIKAQAEVQNQHSMVPDASVPALQVANKTLVQPFERASQKGAEVGRDLAGRALVTPPSEDPASDLYLGNAPAPPITQQEVEERLKGVPAPVVGATRAVGSVVGGMAADPRMWPLFFAGPEASGLKTAMSAGFGTQMAVGAYQQAGELGKILDNPDVPQEDKWEAGANMILSTIMAAQAYGHPINEAIQTRVAEFHNLPPADQAQIAERLRQKAPEIAAEIDQHVAAPPAQAAAPQVTWDDQNTTKPERFRLPRGSSAAEVQGPVQGPNIRTVQVGDKTYAFDQRKINADGVTRAVERGELWRLSGGKAPEAVTAQAEQDLRGEEPEAPKQEAQAAPAVQWDDEKPAEDKQQHEFASTQVNIAPDSELGQRHAQAVAAMPDEHIGPNGKEEEPHMTVRYGLKDDSPEAIAKIKEAASKIAPFEATVGKTGSFPETKEGDRPIIAHVDQHPELNALRSAVEGAGDFKEDTHGEYKPHVSLGYVKPEHVGEYEGGNHLEGGKFPVDHVMLSGKDGGRIRIPLEGKAEDRRTESRGPDRRQDVPTRKALDQMSPDEKDAEISQLRQAADTDKMTGTKTKGAFLRDQAQRPAKALAAIDVDGLKPVNDSQQLGGHHAGDIYLREVSRLLKEHGIDLYRTGGDEFYAPGESEEELKAKLDKAAQVIDNHDFEFELSDGSKFNVKHLGVSYGTGTDWKPGENDTFSVPDADKALYEHKQQRLAAGYRGERGEFGRRIEIRRTEPPNAEISEGKAEPDQRTAEVKPPEGIPAKGEAGRVPLDRLTLAPKEFQYKLNTNEHGVTNLLKGQKWNDDLAGVVSVWHNPADGKTYVVNGHHRVQLARENRVRDLLVRHLNVDSAPEARATGALQNIAEGRGTPVDAAKFFRDSGITPEQLEKRGISLGEATAENGVALSRLDGFLFDKVVSGEMPQSRGAAIGRATDNPATQEAIFKLIEKAEKRGRRVSAGMVADLAIEAKRAKETTTEHTGLFGNSYRTENNALDKAEVSDYIRSQIAKEKRVFGAVASEDKAGVLGQVKGQSIKPGENEKISREAAQAMEVYDKLRATRGPIDDILESSATRLAKRENAGSVKSDAYKQAREEIRKALTGSDRPSTGGLPAGPEAGKEVEGNADRQASVESPPVESEKEPASRPNEGGFSSGPKPGSPEYEALRQKLAALEKPKQAEAKTAGVQRVADRFRVIADGLDKQIEERQRPMTQNPTPKRMREYRSRLHDGENMKRVQLAMRALADAHEQGTVPKGLENIRAKDDVYRLVYKGVEGGGGYYDVIPSQDYANKTPQGKVLQDLMERHKNEPSDAKAAREKASKISQLEADVQFQKLPGYFPTPKPIVERMLDHADIRPGDKVLEPSAGKGNIADLVKEREPEAQLSAIEPQSKLRQILELKGHALADSDFLGHEGHYDKIVMNPPFENGQDIDHVQHAFTVLNPGGKLVAIMSEGSFFRSDRKAQAFREWLEEHNGTSEKLEPGAFKESGTGVNARMVTIEKSDSRAADRQASVRASDNEELRRPKIKSDEPALPGMEPHLEAEKEAKAEKQGEDLTHELTKPKDSISAKAGEMERNSPLFRDTEASGQGGLFGEKTPTDINELHKRGIIPADTTAKSDLSGKTVPPKAPTFYSKAERVAEEKLPNSVKADQVIPTLKNAGVKTDEMKWLGLDDYLKGKDKVSKADLLDHIRQNNVQVQEVMKGDGGGAPKPTKQHNAAVMEWVDKNFKTATTLPDGYDTIFDRHAREGKKWAVTPPGQMHGRPWAGSHPTEKTAIEAALEKFNGENSGAVAQATRALDHIRRGHTESVGDLEELGIPDGILKPYRDYAGAHVGTKFSGYQLPGGENYRELLLTLPEDLIRKGEGPNSPVQRFRSSHFDESNVLAHIRFNDRISPDGKKTLFVEELQSDWHQKGRKGGYIGRTPEERELQLEQNRRGEMVPDAPFKSTWHELAMKRMLRYAAENGYDKIAWTTGEQQAARYDLSKQVDKVMYSPHDGNFVAYKDGKSVIEQHVEPSKLADVVGKDVAEKLLAGDPEKDVRTVQGEDLKVGGAGMKGFYDKILPDFMNKYGKKWGAKVGETEIAAQPEKDFDSFAQQHKRMYPNATPAQTRSAFEKNQSLTPVHSMDITHAMRKEVVFSGQTLHAGIDPIAASRAIVQTVKDASGVIKKGSDLYHGAIDKALDFTHMGQTRPEIRKFDPDAADLATKMDAGGQYHKAVAEMIGKKVTDPQTEKFNPRDTFAERQQKNELSRDRMKGFHFMADEQNREWAKENKPEDYKRWEADPKIQEALKQYKPFEEQLRSAVQQLGGKTIDADYIKRIMDFATSGVAYESPTGELKIGQPQNSRGGGRDNVVSPQIDRSKSRKDAGQYYWDHGVYDFGPSFQKRWTEVMSKLDEHRLAVHAMSMGTRVAPDEPMPEKVFYNGQEFYRPDVAHEIKEVQKNGVSPESKALANALGVSELPTPKNVRQYSTYEPLRRGSRFESAARNLAADVLAGKQGLEGQAANVSNMSKLRYALPKEIVEALNDAGREKEQGALAKKITQVIGPLTQFIRQQIVGLAYGVPHMANILRKVVQSHPLGALNPMGWADAFKVAFSKELKARGISGPEDPTYDMLLRNGAINEGAIPEYKHYIEGNFNPTSWEGLQEATKTAGNAFRKGGKEGAEVTPLSAAAGAGRLAIEPLNRFSEAGHRNLFKQGGIDQRARIWLGDFLKDRYPGMKENRIAHEVNQTLGRYNRASWTDVQKGLAPFMLFPGWDYSSAAFAMKHPFNTAVAPAVLMLLANAAVNSMGGNKSDEKHDMERLHVGKYSGRANILNDNMGSHLWGWALRGAKAGLDHKNAKETTGEMVKGIPGDVAGVTTGTMNPIISTPIQIGANRLAPGRQQEIVKPSDLHKRGKFLPNKAAEDYADFAARRAFPLYDRATQAGQKPSLASFAGLAGVNISEKKKKR